MICQLDLSLHQTMLLKFEWSVRHFTQLECVIQNSYWSATKILRGHLD